jgi:hypothetical protein
MIYDYNEAGKNLYNTEDFLWVKMKGWRFHIVNDYIVNEVWLLYLKNLIFLKRHCMSIYLLMLIKILNLKHFIIGP